MGQLLGAEDGSDIGIVDGANEGIAVGLLEGEQEGAADVGLALGVKLGTAVG